MPTFNTQENQLLRKTFCQRGCTTLLSMTTGWLVFSHHVFGCCMICTCAVHTALTPNLKHGIWKPPVRGHSVLSCGVLFLDTHSRYSKQEYIFPMVLWAGCKICPGIASSCSACIIQTESQRQGIFFPIILKSVLGVFCHIPHVIFTCQGTGRERKIQPHISLQNTLVGALETGSKQRQSKETACFPESVLGESCSPYFLQIRVMLPTNVLESIFK